MTLPPRLRPVHLDDVFLSDFLVNQKLCDYFPLVTLQLDNIPKLNVLNNSAVAVELLFARFKNRFLVDLGVHALHRGQRFPPVPLLRPDVDIPGLHGIRGLLRLFF